jgi:DNA mismatch repair ATPase MutS
MKKSESTNKVDNKVEYIKSTMIQEYFDIYIEKIKEYGEKICVLYENGAFYEIYQIDNEYEKIGNASIISKILNDMKYTSKVIGKIEVNFIGFNTSCLDKFLPMLLNANYTVILVNQLEDSNNRTSKGNLKRGVTKIYSPSLQPLDYNSGNLLSLILDIKTIKSSNKKNASLINTINTSICCVKNEYNEIEITENIFTCKYNDNHGLTLCLDELERIVYRYFPKELQIKIKHEDFWGLKYIEEFFINNYDNVFISYLDKKELKQYLDKDYQNNFFTEVYSHINFGLISPIDYMNINKYELSIINLMFTIEFIGRHDSSYIKNLNLPIIMYENDNLILELNTIEQLNMVSKNTQQRSYNKPESVFDVINYTKTAIGKRHLLSLLCKPFKNKDIIIERYNVTKEIELYIKDIEFILNNISDFEKLHRKMSLDILHPYEFVKLHENYNNILNLSHILKENVNLVNINLSSEDINFFNEYIKDYTNKFNLILMKKIDLNTSKDEIINYFNKNIIPELDIIQDKISNIEKEREELRLFYDSKINSNKTDIKSQMIKLMYTENEGYSFVCTKIRYQLLIEKLKDAKEQYDFRLKQTNNITKFYPEKLLTLSSELLNYRELLHKKIKLHYINIVNDYYKKYKILFSISKKFIEIIDVCYSNYKCKEKYKYTCPELINSDISFFEATQLRHPIIERLGKTYIPNDITLNDIQNGMLLFGLNSSGKCFSPLTKIIMHDGSRKFAKDIIVGDKLMGDNFDCKNVLSTTKGLGQMYKIIPKKGESFECNGPHILSLKSKGYKNIIWDSKEQEYNVNWISNHINHIKSFSVYKFKSKEEAYKQAYIFKHTLKTDKGKIIDISVEEYIKKPSIWKLNYYLYRVPVDFENKYIPLNPYLLGYWLGDTNTLKDNRTLINQNHTAIREKIYGNNNFLKDFKDNQRIPLDYLRNNKEIRLKLLAGFLDADTEQETIYNITLKSETLLNDIIELIRSLGMSAYKSIKKKFNKTCYNNCIENNTYYQCHIYGTYKQLNEIPVLLRKKTISKYTNHNMISFEIKKLKMSEYCGFEVDGNHRFLLNDYTVTHNSSLLRGIGINVILAQCGLYVPCKSFKFSPFNTIISQVDLTDNLFNGKSSFITETLGLKKILKCTGPNTLVLCDEMCKGTEHISSVGLVASTIKRLVSTNTKFFFTTHLHKLKDDDSIVKNNKIQISHLSVNIKNNDIIFERKLTSGNGSELYGLEVAKSILEDDLLIEDAFTIRNKLLNTNTNVLGKKKSLYNTKKIMKKCEICSSTTNLETHHIEFQSTADKDGFLKTGIHKNHLSNLSILCKKCHDNVTYNRIIIEGYKDSINGRFLQWQNNE